MTECFRCYKEITFLKPGYTKDNIQDKRRTTPQEMTKDDLVCSDCYKLIISGEKLPEFPTGGFVLEETGEEENKKKGKPSALWYLVPILLAWIGSLIIWFVLKDEDRQMAKNGVILGIIITFLEGIIYAIAIIVGLASLGI